MIKQSESSPKQVRTTRDILDAQDEYASPFQQLARLALGERMLPSCVHNGPYDNLSHTRREARLLAAFSRPAYLK